MAALAALLLLAVSCGGDDDDNGGTTAATSPPAASATPGSGPGTITLTSSAISGQSGKILLVFATGGDGNRVARLCQPISSDEYELPGSAMTEIPAQDPCGNDPDVVTFDEGTYQLTAGIYVGGEQTPAKTTTLTVDVAGDVTAELDGAELSD
jgi:hypothetical protein